MNAYLLDLRLKVLDAVDRGIPRREVARTFGVSMPTLERYLRRRRQTEELAPRCHRAASGNAAPSRTEKTHPAGHHNSTRGAPKPRAKEAVVFRGSGDPGTERFGSRLAEAGVVRALEHSFRFLRSRKRMASVKKIKASPRWSREPPSVSRSGEWPQAKPT
jgi:hypothetical protein